MDRIKPIDLERVVINKTLFGGYSKPEVDDLVQKVTTEIATLLTEIEQSQEEIARQRKEIETFRAQDATLKEALMLAQRAADDTRAAAHKEAELIVQETLQKNDQLVHDLQVKITDLRWEVEKLRLEKQKFLKGFKAMLEEYLREVEHAQLTEAAKEEIQDDGPSVKVI